jgi:PAS domain S-box-containing protein
MKAVFKNPIGLQARMIASLVLLVSLLMFLITFMEIRRERQSILDQMRKDGIALAHAYALGVENALLLDKAGLSRVTGEASRTDGIAFLQIVDTTGTVIGHTDIGAIGTAVHDTLYDRMQRISITAIEKGKTPIVRFRKDGSRREIFCVIVPLVMLGAVNGVLELGLETSGISLAIAHTNRQSLLLALIALALGIFYILVFARSIVKPIRHLADVAGRIAAGNLDHPIEVRNNDEIGQLAASFIFMTQKLRENLGSLRTSNETLQAHVVTIESLRAYIENIINSVTIGIMTIDTALRITYLNRSGRAIMRLENNDCIGKTIDEVFGRDHYIHTAFVHAAGNTAQPPGDAPLIRDIAAGDRVITLNVTILLDQNKRITGHCAIFEDVTDVRRLQRRLQHTDTMTLMGRLAAGIAHEVRNPLGAIQACAQFLEKNSGFDERNAHFIRLIVRESKRMDDMISRLLNYARPDTCDHQSAAINAVVDTAVELAALKANQLHVPLVKKYGDGLPELPVDEKRLSQAMLNLLLNALDSVDSGGTVTVSTDYDRPARKVRIAVSDTGRGMSKEVQERIFEPFFTTRSDGTGLGLSIVQQIIFEHAGTIEVRSETGRGATFTILLPVNGTENPQPGTGLV